MKSFEVQSVEIEAPYGAVFEYVSDPRRLPEWTAAFESVREGRAVLRTPKGSVEIGLEVQASQDHGTVDWIMTFPDGSIGRACSRLVAVGPGRTAYAFVLLAPPVPLEQLEGALAEQSKTLARELERLRRRLAA